MRLFTALTVSSVLFVVSAFPIQHSTTVERDAPSCDAPAIQDYCNKAQQSGSSGSQSLTDCISAAKAKCADGSSPASKPTEPSCESIKSSCKEKFGSSGDKFTQCVKDHNCPTTPKSSVAPTKRDDCDFDSVHACVQKAGPQADLSDVYECLGDVVGVCCEEMTLLQSQRKRTDVSPFRRNGFAFPGTSASKREDTDTFGFLTPCLEYFLVSDNTPAPVLPTTSSSSSSSSSSSNNDNPASAGTAALAPVSNIAAPSADKREEGSTTSNAGTTALSSGDSSTVPLTQGGQSNPNPAGSARALKTTSNAAAAAAAKREESNSGTVSAGAARKRGDDDSPIIPPAKTDKVAMSDGKRDNTYTIKREDDGFDLNTCLSTVAPSDDARRAKRHIDFPAAKRDDCDVAAFEESCLNTLGPTLDCQLLITCFNGLAQDCQTAQSNDEAKRAEPTCNFAVINHTCAARLGPDATAKTMSDCLHNGLRSSPACANNVEFELPIHVYELTCDIDSIARACQTRRNSMTDYFSCVVSIATSMIGCEQKLLAAMDA